MKNEFSELIDYDKGSKLQLGEEIEVISQDGNCIARYIITELEHKDENIRIDAVRAEKDKK